MQQYSGFVAWLLKVFEKEFLNECRHGFDVDHIDLIPICVHCAVAKVEMRLHDSHPGAFQNARSFQPGQLFL